ncbi:RTA1 like protein [Coleophoma cylindrospora]|uniref:RTA1 like protein n=1 Tax=Coleophoma cylindrospora TaxID=1849047 RepID=A0A3D8R5V3_9HELO|nr:RTA1 like protein [Coleophoma cylindrospora]
MAERFYDYNPSLAAAIIFIALFVLISAAHTYQLLRTRTFFFIPFVIGGIFEIIGYAGRAISSKEAPNFTLGAYIIQALFLLVAPALFAASIYMELGRIILLVDGENLSVIRKKWLTKFFVIGDVTSFLLQGGGGGISASNSTSTRNLGQKILLIGLFIQIAFFGFFIVVAFIFHRRLLKTPTQKLLQHSASLPWLKHLTTLYAASAMIMVRSIFRTIEYIQGRHGYLLKHEIFIYLLDAVLMFLVMVTFAWIHPSELQARLTGGPFFVGWKRAHADKVGDAVESVGRMGYDVEMVGETSTYTGGPKRDVETRDSRTS